MFGIVFSLADLLTFLNVAMTSIVVILAFSLLIYTLTYNFRNLEAQLFVLLLACVMVTYAGDVALNRVINSESAERWLRFQWLGIAMLPAVYYIFSLAVLRITNYQIGPRRFVGALMVGFSLLCALSAFFSTQLVNQVHFSPPLSYLEPGPYFWLFSLYFAIAAALSLRNVWKARQRCLTNGTRNRMTYLLLGFIAPGMGVFPYLIGVSRLSDELGLNLSVLALSLVGNGAVALLLVFMSYSVAYFGVLTPDRMVRHRLLRFFMRGPIVAILAILAIQTIPKVEHILGLPRDIVLFSTVTGVIVFSQLFLSVARPLVDRLIYREDRGEMAWLRELDQRLLTTSDLRQFLENNLTALCELFWVPSGFVAAVVGPELLLEAVIGTDETKGQISDVSNWSEALNRALKEGSPLMPISHEGFWIWPLIDSVPSEEAGSSGKSVRVLGLLGIDARTETPILSQDELDVLDYMIDRIGSALVDRRLQQSVFDSLQRLIPDIDRIQRMRGVVPYTSSGNEEDSVAILLDPSPIHDPEFEAWVKDALSHYWGGPKLTRSPLVQLQVVVGTLERADGNPTKALRLVLGSAIEKLRPDGNQNLSAPEWFLYNFLEMRFIQGHKIREIAQRLAISESDLYRKQRVAIGQVARMLTEMEQKNGHEPHKKIER